MNRARLLSLFVLFFAVTGMAAHNDGDDRLRAFAKLERGLTPEQVKRRVDAPKHIARQILYHRYQEQWLYDAPIPIRLTFDCPRGRKPQLLSPPVIPLDQRR